MVSLRGHTRREFSQKIRKEIFKRACLTCSVDGVANLTGRPQCENCGKEVRAGGFIYEHIDPAGLGGEPTFENGKLHCLGCKIEKDKIDNARMTKADNVLKATYGLKPVKRQKLQSRGFQKAEPQRRASSPVDKWRGF